MTSCDFAELRAGKRLVLSGAGAAARGALEAGVGFVVTYPGSPVVESFDLLAAAVPQTGGEARIVINEHVALHAALGFSLSGGRSLVIMKHVGLNVCSDPLHYSAYLGVRGGLVILVGTDPGATCSTGEFDLRLMALHTHIPIIEPWDFDHAREVTARAFDLSEETSLPVMVMIPSQFCYAMGMVTTNELRPVNKALGFQRDPWLTSVGPGAVRLHQRLHERINRLEYKIAHSQNVSNTQLPASALLGTCFHRSPSEQADDVHTLVIASGIHRDFVNEVISSWGSIDHRVALFSPQITYPFPGENLVAEWERLGRPKLVFLEDLEGFLQIQASSFFASRGLGPEIHGKDLTSGWGILTLDRVSDILDSLLPGPAEEKPSSVNSDSQELAPPQFREGTFCPGCPHRAFFHLLLPLLREGDIIGGDIGCSSLPPHFSDWLTCMNSGPSIALGVSLANRMAGGSSRIVSLIGDSTLFHSGLQTILEASQNDSEQVCFILDNGWTAMTGHQPTPGTRHDSEGRLRGNPVDIKALLLGCGVQRIHTLDPSQMEQARRVIGKAFSQTGFVCVIVQRECALQRGRRKSNQPWETDYFIVPELCRDCGQCYSVLTCPAIIRDRAGFCRIDAFKCVSCGQCLQICPNGAIFRSQSRNLPSGDR